MTFPCGPKRTIYGLLLQVIFMTFLVSGSFGTGLRSWELAKKDKAFSEGTTFEVSSFRNNAGSERTQTFGVKFLNIPRSNQQGSSVDHRSVLLEFIDRAAEISRFLCHIFYVFISSKAP